MPAPSAEPVTPGLASRWRLTPAGRFGLLALVLMVPVLIMLWLAAGPGDGSGFRWPDPRFVSCLVTGASAALLSAWIFALRPRDVAVWLFAVSGLATYGFCLGAGVFFLPIDLTPAVLSTAALINVVAASSFGLAMIALLACYPRPLPQRRWIIAASCLVFPGWTLASWFGPFEPFVEIHRITLAEMVVILLLAGAQLRHTRHEPVERAIAVWLGASIAIGAGGFIALVALPSALERPPLVATEYGFALFIIIYAALAVALLRYRVFGLGRWAFQLLFLAGAVLCVLAVDIAIIVWLALDPARATGFALMLVALAYLPTRSWLWTRLAVRPPPNETALFRSVAGVALAPSPGERSQAWHKLLSDTFAPLEIIPGTAGGKAVAIADEGRMLEVPALDDLAAVALHNRDAGRALFSPADADMVREMLGLIAYLGEARSAYDRGVTSERARIAQDIHDNIGAQLLTALHASGGERKNELIRETIGDLRDVIRNADAEARSLDALLADLRIETADRVELAGLTLEWRGDAVPPFDPPRETLRAVRAFVREAVSNALRHAQASRIDITVTIQGQWLSLDIADDGRGFDAAIARAGHGLGNMQGRIEGLGGHFALLSGSEGTCISARLPLAA
ncbi:MAG: histidine kinase [Porphyrobacter sp. IPPAS B-1204]|nr:MAG: histidine kinase [Porphyrobacter sp. IPPAS B-1204]